MSIDGRTIEVVDVPGWPQPKGYANGVIARGPTLFVAGQIGWTPEGIFTATDLAGQFEQALANVVEVVRAAGAGPADIVKMTVYVTDLDAYRSSLGAVGAAWKKHLGRHFPAMALVGVSGLVERAALVEIETVVALPNPGGDEEAK